MQADDLNAGAENIGHVVAVRGNVVDAHFPQRLPDVNSELRAGRSGEVVVEVLAQLDEDTIRGIALTPTRGLSRGASITDTGHDLRVPVGNELLGRMFDVFGDTIDRREPLHDVTLRSIHQRSPSLAERMATRSRDWADRRVSQPTGVCVHVATVRAAAAAA